MNDDRHLPEREAQGRGDVRLIDFFDAVDLQEVIARAQSANLRQAATQGLVTQYLRVCASQAALLLGMVEVCKAAKPTLGRPARACGNEFFLLGFGQFRDRAFGADAARDRHEESIGQGRELSLDLASLKVSNG